jgi:hypothetical protein
MTLEKRLTKTKKDRLEFEKVKFNFEVTEMICQCLKFSGRTRKFVAKKMGLVDDTLDLMLDGTLSITTDQITEIMFLLDRRPEIRWEYIQSPANPR